MCCESAATRGTVWGISCFTACYCWWRFDCFATWFPNANNWFSAPTTRFIDWTTRFAEKQWMVSVIGAAEHWNFLEEITGTRPLTLSFCFSPKGSFSIQLLSSKIRRNLFGCGSSYLINWSRTNQNAWFCKLRTLFTNALERSVSVDVNRYSWVCVVFSSLFILQLLVNDMRMFLNRGWNEAARQWTAVHAMQEWDQVLLSGSFSEECQWTGSNFEWTASYQFFQPLLWPTDASWLEIKF